MGAINLNEKLVEDSITTWKGMGLKWGNPKICAKSADEWGWWWLVVVGGWWGRGCSGTAARRQQHGTTRHLDDTTGIGATGGGPV